MWQFLNERTIFQRADTDLLLLHFLMQCNFVLTDCSLEGFVHVIMVRCRADATFVCLTEACDTAQAAFCKKEKKENERSIKKQMP